MNTGVNEYIRTMIVQECEAIKKAIEIGAEAKVVGAIGKRLGYYIADLSENEATM